MQNYAKFQQFFCPWNLRSLERDCKEVKRKGVVNPKLENIYKEQKEKLLIKEAREMEFKKAITDEKPPVVAAA